MPVWVLDALAKPTRPSSNQSRDIAIAQIRAETPALPAAFEDAGDEPLIMRPSLSYRANANALLTSREEWLLVNSKESVTNRRLLTPIGE
jgi:hypothetical protein